MPWSISALCAGGSRWPSCDPIRASRSGSGRAGSLSLLVPGTEPVWRPHPQAAAQGPDVAGACAQFGRTPWRTSRPGPGQRPATDRPRARFRPRGLRRPPPPRRSRSEGPGRVSSATAETRAWAEPKKWAEANSTANDGDRFPIDASASATARLAASPASVASTRAPPAFTSPGYPAIRSRHRADGDRPQELPSSNAGCSAAARPPEACGRSVTRNRVAAPSPRDDVAAQIGTMR
jgi:hypothetical protein